MKFRWWLAVGAAVLLFALLAIALPVRHAATNAGEVGSGESLDSAAQLFSQNCVKCHGKDGRSKGLKAKTMGARNLTDAEWQDRVSDERIFNSINNGKGHMPGFGKKLSEAQIDSLVQYVRGLRK
jgi:cbb3-type cytochrome c oxidase subunit III